MLRLKSGRPLINITVSVCVSLVAYLSILSSLLSVSMADYQYPNLVTWYLPPW